MWSADKCLCLSRHVWVYESSCYGADTWRGPSNPAGLGQMERTGRANWAGELRTGPTAREKLIPECGQADYRAWRLQILVMQEETQTQISELRDKWGKYSMKEKGEFAETASCAKPA